MGMTAPQQKLFALLRGGWTPEGVVSVMERGGKRGGYPTHYKVDLLHPELKIAVEIDGASHASLKRREQDRKKDSYLRKCGWRVLRLLNADVEYLCTTYGSRVIHHILQVAS